MSNDGDMDYKPPRPPNAYDLDKRVSLLEAGQKAITGELNKINANLSKLLWVVLTAVVLAVLNLVMNGGGS